MLSSFLFYCTKSKNYLEIRKRRIRIRISSGKNAQFNWAFFMVYFNNATLALF